MRFILSSAKPACSRWKGDGEKKKCGGPDRAVQGTDGGADRAGLPKVSCYTGTQSPLDIYHHLLQTERGAVGVTHNGRGGGVALILGEFGIT